MSGNGFDPDFASAGQWARLYRAHGVQVVPACAFLEVGKGKSWKRPLLKSWTDFQDALVPDEMFERWYGPGGQYATRENMGVITGRASNNLFVIDLDTYRNAMAANWWIGLLAAHNNSMDLETVEQRTGGGGLQKLFRAPEGWVAPTNKTSIGVDIRGQGGFAMLAPSLHESGKHYEWLDGRSPDDLEVTMAPDWLLAEVEKLVSVYGGGSDLNQKVFSHLDGRSTPSNNAIATEKINTGQLRTIADSPQLAAAAQYDAFGHQVDGRESKMRDLIWGAVVDWYRACPIEPCEDESRFKAGDKYLIYEALVAPQQQHPAGLSKTEMLDLEGRGPQEFWAKWQYAMRQWDVEVREEAHKRKPSETGDNQVSVKPSIYPETGFPVSLVLTSRQFVAGFSPPAYLVDGILQRGYLYSLTARTGHGKTAVAMFIAQCIARGVSMHGCSVKAGTVLILAGENPDDVRARFMVLAETFGFSVDTVKIRWIAGVVSLASRMAEIRAAADLIDDLVLVIVDTAAAYFPGDETNSNSQQGAYARLLRELTFLPGKPAVLANCHPVKNAARENLLPMGGSAFLNEVDGNLTLWANAEKQVSLHWLGKFRGPEFNPIAFEIVVATSERVKDAEGRLMPNAVAKPISDDTLDAAEREQISDEDALMWAVHKNKGLSFAKLADIVGVKKIKVQRIMERLKEDKLVVKYRGRKYKLTSKGEKEIGVKVSGSDDDFG